MENDVIKIVVPGKAEYMQTVRIAMGSVTAQAGFDMEKSDDICVSVTEACRIVSCHEHESLSKFYEIKSELLDGKIRITVTDSHEHSLEKKHRPCLICPGEGDMAFDVMKTLMDSVDFGSDENGNRRIIMEKNK